MSLQKLLYSSSVLLALVIAFTLVVAADCSLNWAKGPIWNKFFSLCETKFGGPYLPIPAELAKKVVIFKQFNDQQSYSQTVELSDTLMEKSVIWHRTLKNHRLLVATSTSVITT